MTINIDHVVLWVESSRRSLDFYVTVLGAEPVRLEEFEAEEAPFPSARLNESTILDLMETRMVKAVQDFTGGVGAGGLPINHLCLSVDSAEYAEIAARLAEAGVTLTPGSKKSFGAQGLAERSEYFSDPDGNVIEIRYYKQSRV